MHFLYYLKQIITFIIDIIYPHQCLSCKDFIASSGMCVQCWKKLFFITNPCCSICSEPFEFDTRNDMICGDCLIERPVFDQALCLIDYNDFSKKLIHKLKFQDNYLVAKFFAPMLKNKIMSCQYDIDYIIPVPMHKYKLLTRKYNHAALLARYITKNLKVKSNSDVLIKKIKTKSQASLSKKARLINIKNSFQVNPAYKDKILGKNILIIDDVYTTGATLNECSKILKKNGANKIIVATICKNILNRY
jgi:ComF family protein